MSGDASARRRCATAGRIREAAEQYVRLFNDAAPHEQPLLLDAATAPIADAAGEDVWGPAPSPAEAGAAELAQLRMRFADRRRVVDTSLNADEAATLLRITPQAVSDCIARGELIGLKADGGWMLPAWQFDAKVERGIVPGIARLSDVFPGGVVSLTRWVTRPNADLDNRAPRHVMAAGEHDRVIAVAASLTAAGQ